MSTEKLEKTLADRGEQYGDWRHQADLAQKLKTVLREHAEAHGVKLEPFQAESLDMIFNKISRIGNGNPNHADSWHDIAGYATIAMLRIAPAIPK